MFLMMSSSAIFNRAGELCCVANSSIRPFCRLKDGIAQIFQTHSTIVRVRNQRRHVQEEDRRQPCVASQIKTTKRVGKPLTQKVLQQQCTENWLLSLAASCNMTEGLKSDDAKNSASEESLELCGIGGGLQSVEELSPYPGHGWVLGIDPDVTGALAVLKTDDSGSTAQVFDAPSVQVLVGKSIRRRLDARSIVSLIRGLAAPTGSLAYIEQSTPFPKDGKQGWWSGGFGYGLWIGILVASGFCVIPVPSAIWKSHFELAGRTSSKDESRAFASSLFPAVSSLFKRKKDHGRAEALLIAAYGRDVAKMTRN